MKIVTIGTGYVGIVHAAVCSEYGHDVYAHDIDREKIKAFSSGRSERIEKYVNEPGLFNIIRETLGKSLHFSDDLEAIIEGTDAIFMCLPTPSNIDGSTNLTFYDAAAESIAEAIIGSSRWKPARSHAICTSSGSIVRGEGTIAMSSKP